MVQPATTTGGRNLADADVMIEPPVPFTASAVVSETSVSRLRRPAFFALLVGLYALELVLRRRWRLL